MYQSAQFAWLGNRPVTLDRVAVARALHEGLKSPGTEKLLKQVESQDWDGIARNSCNPLDYSDPIAFFHDRIPMDLFRKAEDLGCTVDTEASTFKKWMQAEQECYKTNLRLDPYVRRHTLYDDNEKAISRHIDGVRKIILSWIGKTPSSFELGFSPGSTLSDRGARATIAHKLHKSPTSTPQYESIGFDGFIGTLWHHNMADARLKPTIVRFEEYFTVPKTSLVRRAAGMQPTLNISAQLGIGRQLRKKLARNTGLSLTDCGNLFYKKGWDIRVAQEIHGEVARKSSVDRSFCTIDLSSASDTIARALVELLLPRAWFRLMDGLRTHHVKLPKEIAGVPTMVEDHIRKLEKFSSMGNGFTFELETIIFAAIACYVTRLNGYWGELGFDVFVYGDDIIVRDELFFEVKSMLTFFGFTLNMDKSFHGDHPFRESCGYDYFNGVNVTTTKLEKVNDLDVDEVISTVNQVKHLSERVSSSSDENLNRLWFQLLRNLPKGVSRVRGPAHFGDCVVYDPNESTWITREITSRKGLDIHFKPYTFRVHDLELLTIQNDSSESFIPWFRFDPATQLATAVLGFGDGKRGILPRNPPKKFGFAWTTLSCVSTP